MGEGLFLLLSICRVCALFAAVSAFTVGPAVLWGGRGWRSCKSAAPTDASSASAASAEIASMVGGVGEL